MAACKHLSDALFLSRHLKTVYNISRGSRAQQLAGKALYQGVTPSRAFESVSYPALWTHLVRRHQARRANNATSATYRKQIKFPDEIRLMQAEASSQDGC